MDQEDGNRLKETAEHLKNYIEDRFKLFRLEAVERFSKEIAHGVSFFILSFLAAFFLLFISLTGAFFLSEHFNSEFMGFGIIAAAYLVLVLLFLLLRKPLLETPMINRIIKRIFKDQE